MQSYERFQTDLRVVLTLLLRIHLSPKRFFGKKATKSSVVSNKDSKRKKSRNQKYSKYKAMSDLFKILQKFNSSDNYGNKFHVIQKLVNTIMQKKN